MKYKPCYQLPLNDTHTHNTEIGISGLKQIILAPLLAYFFPIISTLSITVISLYKTKTYLPLWHSQLFATEFPTNLSVQLKM